MKIRLTKGYKKPNGKLIKKGTVIQCLAGHPYKDFVLVDEDDTVKKVSDEPKDEAKDSKKK